MEYLIERGANVNAMTGNKETALFWAAAQGHIDAIKILLKNGADTELKNKKDQTALDVAKELNRNKVIELLKN
jgi:ankyrin repeat protein